MTTVATCSNPAEAELLQSLLHEAGIEAFVPDEMFGAMIRVQVAPEQAEEARKIIDAAAMPEEGHEEENRPDDAGAGKG